MRMLRDHVAVIKVRRYAGHLPEKPPARGKKDALALVRHFLSRYREKPSPASAIPKGQRRRGAGGKRCSHQQRWSASSPQRTTTKREPFTKASLDFNS